MKRTEFIEQLRDLLREVDQEEKEEALQYYEDYLEAEALPCSTSTRSSCAPRSRIS